MTRRNGDGFGGASAAAPISTSGGDDRRRRRRHSLPRGRRSVASVTFLLLVAAIYDASASVVSNGGRPDARPAVASGRTHVGRDDDVLRRALLTLRSVDGLVGLDGLCLSANARAGVGAGGAAGLDGLLPRCRDGAAEAQAAASSSSPLSEESRLRRTAAEGRARPRRRLGETPDGDETAPPPPVEAEETVVDPGEEEDVVGISVADNGGEAEGDAGASGVTPQGATAPAEEGGECGESESGPHPTSYYVFNGLLAFACVCVAALAAGLTLGVLSLDPLMLLIKVRAGATEKERRQAASLLPVVRQHHFLLVTLLLMNSIANEALPLFLDKIFGPLGAVVVSVTLVLFFGEIIPSAVFTGPNQLSIAAALVPLLKVIMALLCPLAWPIAKALDCLLHDDDDEDGGASAHGMSVYNRGELSALVRIQYEERLAAKQRRKAEMRKLKSGGGGSGSSLSGSLSMSERRSKRLLGHSAAGGGAMALSSKILEEEAVTTDWSERSSETELAASLRSIDPRHVVRTLSREMEHQQRLAEMGLQHGGGSSLQLEGGVAAAGGPAATAGIEALGTASTASVSTLLAGGEKSTASILHQDEVTMVEGALRMKETLAMDAYSPMRGVFAVPEDMVLDEENVVDIFSQGYSRVPVYRQEEQGEGEGAAAPADGDGEGDEGKDGGEDHETKKAICGVLIAKNLIVVDPNDEREVSTLPLQQPLCVPPTMNLVDLLNLMQTGGRGLKGGHLAVVCARPDAANKALDAGEAIPEEAGVMGIITLEDIIEELLQEEIYDEYDRAEMLAMEKAQWAVGRWKKYVKKRKSARSREEALNGGGGEGDSDEGPAMKKVVEAAVRFSERFSERFSKRFENALLGGSFAAMASEHRRDSSGEIEPLLEEVAEEREEGGGGDSKYGTVIPEGN